MPQIFDHFHTFGSHGNVHGSHNAYKFHNNVHTPAVDIRETDSDYYFDIELPGVTDRNSVSIQWTSSRTLVVEGQVSRPSISQPQQQKQQHNSTEDKRWAEDGTTLAEPYDLEQGGGDDFDEDNKAAGEAGTTPNTAKTDTDGGSNKANWPPRTNQVVWAEEKRWAEDGVTLHEPYDLEQGGGEDEPDYKPNTSQKETTETSNGHAQQKTAQLSRGSAERVVLGERVIGHFKRDFTFPVDVDRKALKAVLAGGVLTVKTPKVEKEEFSEKVRIEVV